jgi:hypothetical protein
MGKLILPKRELERPASFKKSLKPLWKAEINWDHWSSQGLVASYEFQFRDQSVIDLVSGRVVQLPSNHFITPQGLYMKAHDGITLDVIPQNLLANDQWAILSAGSGFDAGGRPNVFYSEIGVNNGDLIEISRKSFGSVLRLEVSVDFSTSVLDGTVNIRGTGEHAFLAQKRKGNLELYTDSSDLQTLAQTATDSSNNTATIGNSLRNTSVNDVDEGTLNYLRLYKNRTFTAAQARSIRLNPYQHLIPA